MPSTAARRLGLAPGHRRLLTGVQPLPLSAESSQGAPFVRAPAEANSAAPESVPFGFLDKPEPELLQALRSGQLQSVEKGKSGRTLAFKLTFDSGVSGYYKPEQRIPGANWYAEVAAYYLDRALAIGRVPPVVSRTFAWKELEAAAAGDPRAKKVVVDKDGNVRGALIYWVPGKLVPAATPAGWDAWTRTEAGEATVPDPPRPEFPAELSDLLVFDFLTQTEGRFGESNANLLTLGEHGPLIFLDNGSGFSAAAARRATVDARLANVSKFRRRTVDALRALDLDQLKATMTADPLGPILDAGMWRGLSARRTAVLDLVARQEKRFGDAVYAW
jgi:hypothetical protein